MITIAEPVQSQTIASGTSIQISGTASDFNWNPFTPSPKIESVTAQLDGGPPVNLAFTSTGFWWLITNVTYQGSIPAPANGDHQITVTAKFDLDTFQAQVSFTVAIPTSQHALYRGTDNLIHELRSSPTTGWEVGPLDQTTHMPAASGDPCAYADSDNILHVVYPGAGGLLHDLAWSPGTGWQMGQLDQLPHVPRAIGHPSSYDFDGTQHVVFLGFGGVIHDLVWTPGTGWQIGELDQTPSMPAAAGSPSGTMTPSPFDRGPRPDEQHVVYRGKDWLLHELWWSWETQRPPITHWVVGAIDQVPSVALAAEGASIFYWYILHVIYRGSADALLHELVWDFDGGWRVGSLDQVARPPAVGNPNSYYVMADDTWHVVCAGTAGVVHELVSSSAGWQLSGLDRVPNVPAAAGDPCGYALDDGTQHIVYRGTDNLIHELVWSQGTGWQVGTLAQVPNMPTAYGDPRALLGPGF
jgi:hypothetical protein